ncbi:hypothetical protein BUL40_07450 [Croceivirga radicis]|uniref:RNA polymerase sigma factor 70 region 4 type 2 domain-containing protein n=1 Tax=Croceivirga radicis TaxID=1929488 RepID=A0A1V6LRW7_9FLAO|nr:sigma-70 family RNA polymerase sigma factor [Croceivirga radicis]OQD42922.1 hypothetical protein BUL40_07450 [Croceivirga radicis]
MEVIDQILWSEFKKGKQDAFKSLFKKYYSPLYFYGLKLSANQDMTKEVLQDFFVYLHTNAANFSQVENVKAYLMISFRRLILKEIAKQRKVMQQTTSIETGAVFNFLEEELNKNQNNSFADNVTLLKHLNQLPERQKEVIYLKFYNNLSVKQIADVMEISAQSVSNTLQKAFSKLRKSIESDQILSILK